MLLSRKVYHVQENIKPMNTCIYSLEGNLVEIRGLLWPMWPMYRQIQWNQSHCF